MSENDHDDERLAAFFAAARDTAPAPSEALIARVLADAEAARPRPAPLRGPVRETLWTRLADMLGGWQGVGGLATATVAGLWIGYAGLADPADLAVGASAATDTVELMPTADVFALALGTE